MSALPLPVLTAVGQAAFLAAQSGGPAVSLTHISLGSAARLPTGEETDLTNQFAHAPIASHQLIDLEHGKQLDLGVEFDGPDYDLEGTTPVREIGVWDAEERLIYYWSTTDSLGSLTPATAYGLSIAVAMADAEAEVVVIVDTGPPWGALFEARMQDVEAGIASSRSAAWRNLFLAQQ